MTQLDYLTQLEAELRSVLAEVRSQLVPLPPDALRRRPTPDSWNSLECIAHLNQYAEDYLHAMQLAIHRAKARQWVQGETIKYTGRGRRLIRRAETGNSKHYKSLKRYNFAHQALEPEVLKSFIINSEQILRILQAAREVDINKATVNKAHAWVGKYTLANLLEFMVKHARKHVEQAKILAQG